MNKSLFKRFLFFVIIVVAVSFIHLIMPAIYSRCGAFIVKADEGFSLPWPKCSTFNVSQGNNGTFSHLDGTKMEYAIDFALPEGTELSSIHSGIVTDTKSEFGDTDCGDKSYASKANYVVVDHGDGTSALYLHLKSVRVSKGDKVSKGQIIGLSGKTGWSYCKAHLHFQLQQTGGYFTQSIPISFSDVEGGIPTKGTPVHSENVTPSNNSINKTVTVPGSAEWFDTGISVTKGQSISFSATGSVNTWNGNSYANSGPGGQPYNCPGSVPNDRCLINGKGFGTLVGKIGGDGGAFSIGPGLSIISLNGGTIFLAANDRYGAFSDNLGAYEVTLSVK